MDGTEVFQGLTDLSQVLKVCVSRRSNKECCVSQQHDPTRKWPLALGAGIKRPSRMQAIDRIWEAGWLSHSLWQTEVVVG
jgi:hypothetical protein